MTEHWPQYVTASLLIAITIANITNHGKPMKDLDMKFNAMAGIWNSLLFTLLLGAGGYWRF